MREPSAGQAWDATAYAKNARFVADLGMPVLDLLAPRAGETILDLGCGDGALTTQIARTGAAVVGVDPSPQMVAAARAAGVDARVGDARDLGWAADFDAVFSNAALHWVPEPERVASSVHRALRPGGRFVGEFGGHGNVAAIRTALTAVLTARGIAVANPWYFPTTDEYARLLQAAGFSVTQIALIARPTPLPTGLSGWLATFADPFVAGIDARDRTAIVADVSDLLAPVLRDTGGRWTADYVRLRFAAVREGDAR